MFQVERLKVVNGTINQVFYEIEAGKVDNIAELIEVASDCQTNLTTLRIRLNQMKNNESEEQHNEDS